MSARAKTMYLVEKFIPPACPRCQKAFLAHGTDYTLLLGDIIEGKKRIRVSPGYDIIVCTGCQNLTARVLLESRQVAHRRTAEVLLKDGFVNPQRIKAYGSLARELRTVFARVPARMVTEALGAGEPG